MNDTPGLTTPVADAANGRPLDKLRSIDELSAITREAQATGATVVLAHGTFDLIHIGHLRHLRQARAEGSMLLVTITADAFVTKGPGRPVFSERMRAEMLAALECVDFVGIQHAPKAIDAIRTIRPDVYAKGSDYKNPDDDVTGGIVEERNAVEAHGGRIAFTEDVTFSSSSLINRHLSVFDPTLDEFLEAQREKDVLGPLLELLDRVKDYRVLMVGDAIIDDYRYVSAMGKSPKETMIATLFHDREVFAGGVFAAATVAPLPVRTCARGPPWGGREGGSLPGSGCGSGVWTLVSSAPLSTARPSTASPSTAPACLLLAAGIRFARGLFVCPPGLGVAAGGFAGGPGLAPLFGEPLLRPALAALLEVEADHRHDLAFQHLHRAAEPLGQPFRVVGQPAAWRPPGEHQGQHVDAVMRPSARVRRRRIAQVGIGVELEERILGHQVLTPPGVQADAP